MFVPVSCDALLYHWPKATVALILINVAVFVAMLTGRIDPLHGWVLMYGQGLHPTEWFLSLFTHAGLGHLLGNMFFLWTFGLVTEGKLGSLRFLACYLLIGAGESGLEQAIMLHASPGPGSLGASAAIYGLMAMACIWAPMNEVKMVGFFGYYFFTFDVAVGLLSAIYVGFDLTLVMLLGSDAASSLLHLTGAVIGGVLGTVLLKRKLVECEHWDLFAVLRDEAGKPTAAELAPPSAEAVAAHQQRRSQEAKRKILAYLHINEAPQALLLIRKLQDLKLPLELNRNEQLSLILGLHKHKRWAESAPLMAKFLEEFPDDSAAVRLRLAQICLVELQRPAKTLELLAPLSSAALNEKQNLLRKELTKVANKQIAEGAVELDEAI